MQEQKDILEDIPVEYMTIDEEDINYLFNKGVYAVGNVLQPATEVNWVTLSYEETILKFQKDQSLQEVVGPLLIPDQKIPRDGGKRRIAFTAETIKKVGHYYMRAMRNNNFTHEHVISIPHMTVVELWIKEDEQIDKSTLYGFDYLPVGTLFIRAKCWDDEYWQKYIKSGEVKGFSIEGLFDNVEKLKNKYKMKEQEEELQQLSEQEAEIENKIKKYIMGFFTNMLKSKEDVQLEADTVKVEAEKKDKDEKVVMRDIAIADGSVITFPEDSWELVAVDADGNEIGKVVYMPMEESASELVDVARTGEDVDDLDAVTMSKDEYVALGKILQSSQDTLNNVATKVTELESELSRLKGETVPAAEIEQDRSVRLGKEKEKEITGADLMHQIAQARAQKNNKNK